MCGTFIVDFNWASQAIIETVQAAFPSLESPNGGPIAVDPVPPALVFREESARVHSDFGNGNWQQDTSKRYNAGCNRDIQVLPQRGEVGRVASAEHFARLERWFLDRYAGSRPQVLSNGCKKNFVLVRNQCVYNFHLCAG
jgi:hypothetical protein